MSEEFLSYWGNELNKDREVFQRVLLLQFPGGSQALRVLSSAGARQMI
jgi:hypothetical protein